MPRMRACRKTRRTALAQALPALRPSVRVARSRADRTEIRSAALSRSALAQLRGVVLGHLLGGSCVVLHTGIAAIAAPIGGPAEVIGQIEIVGVGAGNT